LTLDKKQEFREYLKTLNAAKEKPSDECIKGKVHDFAYIAHADGKESYTYFYRCLHCKEIIKLVSQRSEDDPMLWIE
jgi:hypothetical protein